MKKLIIILIIGLATIASGAYYVSQYGNPFTKVSKDTKIEIENFNKLGVQDKLKALPAYSKNYISGADIDDFMNKAIKQAKAQNKNIFVLAGGNWCKWCSTLDGFLENNPEVFNELYNNFVVVKAFYKFNSPKVDKDFFDKLPEVKATPHFYIFDSDGKLIKDIGSAKFERGYSYNNQKLIQLFKKYTK